MTRPWRGLALALLLAWPALLQAQVPPLLRLFLTDGTAIACAGEWARVESRVVCSMPIGGTPVDPRLQLVSIPDDRVDWGATERYAAAVRAAHYGATRGDEDFVALSVRVASTLNEIGLTTDPARRLAIATEARRLLGNWPGAEYGYRAEDVRQIGGLIDEAIAEFRAAAGLQSFDLSLVAPAPAPVPEPLLPSPTPDETVTQAMAVAEFAASSAERISLLEAVARFLEEAADRLSFGVLTRARAAVTARLAGERATDRAYQVLATEVLAAADRATARADVAAVERLARTARHRDEQLGRKRPDEMAAILETVSDRLDSARRLRLARDQHSVRVHAYRSYQRSVTPPVGDLHRMAGGLEDIRRLAGPPPTELSSLASQAARAIQRLRAVVPPAEAGGVHSILLGAAQLAAQAVETRRQAVESGEMRAAWNASAAAAGSMLLLARARADLRTLLTPPRLP